MVARVTAEVPEIDGDRFGLEGKEIGSFVFPFCDLRKEGGVRVCVCVGITGGEK